MRISPKKKPQGFTIIELLVAMAITTLIITVLISVTATSIDMWNRSRNEVGAARQSKSMLDSVATDLESMVVSKGNDFQWLVAKANTAAVGNSPNNIDLYFFSAASDRYLGQIGTPSDLGGDVSGIAYQLQYNDPIGGGSNSQALNTYVLYRKLVDPNLAFANLLGKKDLASTFSAFAGDIGTNQNFIAENIYQFTITFHVTASIPDPADPTDPTKNTLVNIPVSVGDSTNNQVSEFTITGNGFITSLPSSLPQGVAVTIEQLEAGQLTSIEISMTVLSDSAMTQLKARSDLANDATKLEEFISKNAYQYTKLVPITSS